MQNNNSAMNGNVANSKKTFELVLAALFGVFTFLGTYISIPMYPVPITLQTFFVLLCGFYLNPYYSALSMALCLLLRFLTSGFSVFVTPSFGFLIAFIVAASFVSSQRQKKHLAFGQVILLLVVAEVVLYLIGLPYMAYVLNVYLGKNLSFFTILKVGMLLFIPGDAIKLLVAAYIYRSLPELKLLRK